jgi:PAS domain S-box-containing protein
LVELVNKELLNSLVDLEDLYQNAPCGYLSFLPNGTVIKINQTLLQWLGYAEEEVLYKKKFIDLITKGGVIYYEMFYLALLKMKGRVNEINYDIIRKNGTSFPGLVNSVVLKDSFGEHRAINATIFDITDRKKYERELLHATRLAEAEKKRFEFLADLIPEIIWTATPDGNIDYVNKRFYEFFDAVPTNLTPEFLISKVHPDDQQKCFRNWIHSIRRGTDFQQEVRLEKKPGYYQWHLLRAVAYKDLEGIITKWFGSCTNIDDHVLALQRKDEFINIASHELKTPITSLKAYNQLLQRIDSSDVVKSYIDKSAATLSNLHFLVSSLLDVAQINSGQLRINLEHISLNKVLRQSIDSIRLNYPSHEVIEDYDADEEILVVADHQRLIQVMINLLSNAIKYSPEADKVILRVTRDEKNGLVKIEVIDFGLGIPEEQIKTVFERYYRVKDNNNNKWVAGLGLGLYIIQRIIKLHGSRINVKSEVGKGSAFYFTLQTIAKENSFDIR